MNAIVEYIIPYLDRYNKQINDSRLCTGYLVSRRGCCGLINLTTLIPKLIADLGLEKKDISSDINGQMYDIYYSPIKNFYIKRLCVCDGNCLSKCGRNKNKLSCDGHHTIIVSLNNSLDIDEDNDYVIDFTYKQMIYSVDEEVSNMETMRKMPDYLFVPYLRYVNYSSTRRWIINITEPCKTIVNNSNIVESKFKEKYFKYKNKYLELKKLVNK
jgi:hypothetical protein